MNGLSAPACLVLATLSHHPATIRVIVRAPGLGRRVETVRQMLGSLRRRELVRCFEGPCSFKLWSITKLGRRELKRSLPLRFETQFGRRLLLYGP